MSAMTDFDAEIAAWLDDPKVTGLTDGPHAPAGAYGAMDRAITEADTHETCTPEPFRAFDVVLRVYGTDGAWVVQAIPPGTNVSCVLRALTEDPDVSNVQMVGYRKLDEPIGPDQQVTTENEVTVTSDVLDLRATWTKDPKHLRPRRFRLPWRRNPA